MRVRGHLPCFSSSSFLAVSLSSSLISCTVSLSRLLGLPVSRGGVWVGCHGDVVSKVDVGGFIALLDPVFVVEGLRDGCLSLPCDLGFARTNNLMNTILIFHPSIL